MSNPNAESSSAEAPQTVIRLQIAAYGMDAIATAAHRFTDRCFVRLEREDEGVVVCSFRAKRRDDDVRTLAGEFENEVLDQMLRAKLAAETEPLRLLLLAHAFSKTNILNPELDDALPMSDPLQIGNPDNAAR